MSDLAKGWWHQTARDLRAAGASLSQIAETFGVTRQRAQQVCQGVHCPVDHSAIQIARLSDPGWRASHWKPRPAIKRYEGEDYIRANYNKISAAMIGKHLGITKNAVIGRARDLGLAKPKLARAA